MKRIEGAEAKTCPREAYMPGEMNGRMDTLRGIPR